MAATSAQIATIVGDITTTIPANAAISSSVITAYVTNLLNALDSEVVAAATVAAQLAEKNAIVAKVKQH